MILSVFRLLLILSSESMAGRCLGLGRDASWVVDSVTPASMGNADLVDSIALGGSTTSHDVLDINVDWESTDAWVPGRRVGV